MQVEILRSIQYILIIGSFVGTCLYGLSLWEGDNAADKIASMKSGASNPYKEFNEFINGLFFQYSGLQFVPGLVVEKLGEENGYYALCYLRDLFMGSCVYWITGGLWHIYIYHIRGNDFFVKKGRPFPTVETFIDQMQLAQASLFIYAGLPVFSEFLIENKLTQTYFYLAEVGWKMYALYFVIYIALVEIGVYWVHRKLHTNKFLYKYVHGLHHKYNKSETLTPWCSIAFSPIDGICQASPYVFFLFFVPVHYFTHVFLLFFSGVWATNIHDSMWVDSEPLMGSKYHTMHHTHYHYNFGQFFIFADYIFGSYKSPEKSKFD